MTQHQYKLNDIGMILNMNLTDHPDHQQAEKLKSRKMKEGWMNNDEGRMKNEDWWRMNDEGWWFQAVERICRQTDKLTFVNVERLKTLNLIS